MHEKVGRALARSRFFLVTAAAMLAACGGGGGGSSEAGPGNGGGGGGGGSVVLTGTAVRGAALGNVAVQVKCASGTGQATTDSQGRFTVTVTGGSLPCVLQAPLPDGSMLHSAVGGSGSSATVNISPLTELALAGGLGVDPATLFAEFDQRRGSVTVEALNAGVQQVVASLQGTVDLTGVNPLSDPLQVGNALDQKIDQLNEALAEAGSSLADLRQTLATTPPPGAQTPPPPANGDYDSGTSAAASVAAEVVLKPGADSCSALRTGKARYVNLTAAADFDTGTAEVDARTLKLSFTDGGSDTLVPIGTCRYRHTNVDTELVVSPAGIGVSRLSRPSAADPSTREFVLGIAFPEQTHALAGLAGSWNSLGQWAAQGGGYRLRAGSLTLDNAGAVTAATTCADLKTCTDGLSDMAGALAVNTTGGFDLKAAGGAIKARAFFFRAGGGAMMGLLKWADGSYLFLTRPRSNELPQVLGVPARSWNANLGPQLVSTSAIGDSGNTPESKNEAAQSFVRQAIFGFAGTTVAETLEVNKPRNGYTTRLAEASAPTSTGGTSAVREFVFLSLRGMGMTPVALPATATANEAMVLSVTQTGASFVAAEMVNRVRARDCAALRSGVYRIVSAQPESAGPPTQRMTIDAATLELQVDGGGTDTLQADGPCHYTNADGFSIAVSPAGVLVVRDPVENRLRVAFPEQVHAVSELAGTWNKLGLQSPETSGGKYFPDAATVTHDAAGSASQALYCIDVANCQTLALSPPITHAQHTAGGFDRSNGGTFDRAFLFRAGNGESMLVVTDLRGSLGFWTQQRRNALPEVGTRSRFWQFIVGADLATTTGVSADTAVSLGKEGSIDLIVRDRITANGAKVRETQRANSPRDGYTFRAAATATASDGATVGISEFTSLFLRGMGLSALKIGATPDPTFMLAVSQP